MSKANQLSVQPFLGGRRRPRHSIARHLFLRAAPLVALLYLLTLLLLAYQDHQAQQQSLQGRAELMASLVAQALAPSPRPLQRSETASRLAALARDPAVARLVLVDGNGDTMFSKQAKRGEDVGSVTVRQPVGGGAASTPSSQLTLTMASPTPWGTLYRETAVALAMVALALIALWWTLHRGVARLVLPPLERMTAAVRELRDERRMSALGGRDDEFGPVFTALDELAGELRLDDQPSPALEQLELVHLELERSNTAMWQSIHYARKVQERMLPAADTLHNLVNDLAIDWQPQDVVSGDLYWLEHRADKALIFLADCAGQGLPAALTTLLIAHELRHTLAELPWDSPATILLRLGERAGNRLRRDQSGGRADDGLEASLCLVDQAEGHVRFAGTSMPLVHMSADETNVVPGARGNLEDKGSLSDASLSDHVVPFLPGDRFYLFTDGVSEQIGEGSGEVFGQGNVIATLNRRSGEELRTQLDELNVALLEHRGGEGLRDDATIVAFQPAKAIDT